MNITELYQLYLQHPVISTDTRNIPTDALFFALKGEYFNGNSFAAAALEAGAAYCIIDEEVNVVDARLIKVENTLATLQALALHHRQQLNIPVLGITGSNGKTTTKELVHTVLNTKYKTVATIGNLNNHIGVPLTLLRIPLDAEMAIVEMGANHIGEIASYCAYAQPNFAMINNCGKAHLEGFGGIEGVRKGKGELYDFVRSHDGTIFINNDLDYLQEMAQGIDHRFSYGQSNADIIGKDISDSPLLKIAILNHTLETTIATQLTGSYNLPNVLAAVAVGTYFGIDIDTIKAAIEAYAPSNSRSQWLKTNHNDVILDAYNANPSSMEVALINFAKIEAEQKVLLLGGMKEVGAYSEVEHQRIVALCQELGFTQVYLVGPEFKSISQNIYPVFDNSLSLKTYLLDHAITQSLVLIKGSRGSKMEQVVDIL